MNIRPNEDMALPSTACAEPIEDAVVAMAYVPMQEYGVMYGEDIALNAGTLFPCLYKPFCGKKATE